VGAGGLGSAALYYLVGAGIGIIGICDGDKVSITNLHRQILFQESQIGHFKSTQAVTRLKSFNSHIQLIDIPYFINENNVLNILADYDYILDASDNFQTKVVLNDACHYLKKPLVTASVQGFRGQCMVFKYPGPCWRCVYSDIPDHLPNCQQQGVLGPVPGILGTLQALEIIKLCLNLSPSLAGKLWCWDMMRAMPRVYELSQSNRCCLCTGTKDFVNLWPQHPVSRNHIVLDSQIQPQELAQLLNARADIFLLDVRNLDEHQSFNIGGTLIPVMELQNRLSEIPSDKPIVVYCRSGHRSQIALELLNHFGFQDVKNLIGGMLAWRAEMKACISE
jgi:adenylyltransferase/sulfurtransferase